ncbi:MAG: sigma-70 family RNA polymerase sigma factor [Deltaproteobacteria bacterium]|nr:sigma-70 family RNA polymerase sigma factor [Deltaproteobacteria bacterium]
MVPKTDARGITDNRTNADERVRTIEMLHRRYAGIIYDLCVRILMDRQEAEDAVQETYLNAFRFLSSYRYGDSYLPWLYQIATNVCLKLIRTRKRKGTTPTDNIDRMATEQDDPLSAIDTRRILEALVGGLDKRSIEIVVAHYIWGMDQGQIAQTIGISRRAVVKRLSALKRRVDPLFVKELRHG